MIDAVDATRYVLDAIRHDVVIQLPPYPDVEYVSFARKEARRKLADKLIELLTDGNPFSVRLEVEEPPELHVRAYQRNPFLYEDKPTIRYTMLVDEKDKTRPMIVCLCGSTRFSAAYREANLKETLAGRIVLTIGCDMRSDGEFAYLSDEERAGIKTNLDTLHLRKIDLADEILVLNVGGYIGDSTTREIEYAQRHGKRVRFWEEKRGEES